VAHRSGPPARLSAREGGWGREAEENFRARGFAVDGRGDPLARDLQVSVSDTLILRNVAFSKKAVAPRPRRRLHGWLAEKNC